MWKSLKLGTSCFSFEDFRICSHFNNVNCGAWYVYKPLFSSSVATYRLACSEISLSIIGKKLKRSPGKGRTWYNLADGVTALAQLYALYSHRARSFNQWQRALYPNFIIIISKGYRVTLENLKSSCSTRFTLTHSLCLIQSLKVWMNCLKCLTRLRSSYICIVLQRCMLPNGW